MKLGRDTVSKIPYYDGESDYRKVLIFLTLKTFKSTKAIQTLCKEGYGQDAKVLLRSMIDSLITLAYIQKDKENLSKRFIEFSSAEKHKLLQIIGSKNIYPTTPLDEERLKKHKEIEKGYKKYKSDYGYKSDRSLPNNWSGKTTAEMAEKAKVKDLYDWVFRFTSQTTHPSASQANEYILGLDQGGKIVLEVGPSEQWIKESLYMAVIILLWFLGQLDEEYSIGNKEEMERLFEKLKNKIKENSKRQRRVASKTSENL